MMTSNKWKSSSVGDGKSQIQKNPWIFKSNQTFVSLGEYEGDWKLVVLLKTKFKEVEDQN